MYLYIYLVNLFYYLIYINIILCIMLNVYIDFHCASSCIVQNHRILLYKYGAVWINKHLHKLL